MKCLKLTLALAGSADVSRNGNVIEARVESPPHIPEPQDESRRKRKRAANWNPDETLKLLESRLQPSTLDKGKSEWEAISKRIPGRTGQQCQQRWDTVVRPYKKIKSHCDAHGKDYSQVTEAEFRSMKLGNIDSVSYGDLFKRIDEYYSRKSGKGSMASSTAAIGENDLPSGAPDALPPKLVTAAYPVQQTKSTDFGAAVCFPHNPLQWKVILRIVSRLSCRCFWNYRSFIFAFSIIAHT